MKEYTAGSVKAGKPPQGKYGYPFVETCFGGRMPILPGLPAVGDGLCHSWGKRSLTAFRSGTKGTTKKESHPKSPVKAPLWHKRKRNGPCVISLKRLRRLRRDAKPFSPLMR